MATATLTATVVVTNAEAFAAFARMLDLARELAIEHEADDPRFAELAESFRQFDPHIQSAAVDHEGVTIIGFA